MPVAPGDVATLLADAERSAGRVGEPLRGQILDGVGTLKRTPRSDATYSEAVASLALLVNRASQQPGPSTTADLLARWYSLANSAYAAVRRALLIPIAIALVFSIGYFTYVYKEESILQEQLIALQVEDFPAKAEHLYNDWIRLKSNSRLALSPSTPDSSEYYQELSEVRRVGDNIGVTNDRAVDLFNKATLVDLRDYISHLAPASTAKCKAPASSSDAPVGPSDQSKLSDDVHYTDDSDHSCPTEPGDQSKTTKSASQDETTDQLSTDDDDIDVSHFLSFVRIAKFRDIPIDQMSGVITADIEASNQIINAYGLWVLPALYALFGAMVFYFRAVMNPLAPTPRLPIIRATLAVMSGVSISWLLSSFNSKAIGDHAGGIGVFTLAFLFGFSIEVFFAVLDSLVQRALKMFPNLAADAA
jgi:hypothetical protein